MHTFLHAFLNNDFVALAKIYNQCSQLAHSIVTKNSGSAEDAEDLLQEVMKIMYEKARDGNNFPSDDEFYAVFKGICWNQWLKKLKKRGKRVTFPPEGVLDVNLDDTWEEIIRENKKTSLYEKHFNLLGERCQNLLKFSFEKVPMKEIALHMKFASKDVAKKEVSKCRRKLDKRIKNDPDYRDIIS